MIHQPAGLATGASRHNDIGTLRHRKPVDRQHRIGTNYRAELVRDLDRVKAGVRELYIC